MANLTGDIKVCTPSEHLTMMESSSYCPACGDSKPIEDDYCTVCASVEDTVIIHDVNGWQAESMYPYDILPEYTVGYVADVTTWCP